MKSLLVQHPSAHILTGKLIRFDAPFNICVNTWHEYGTDTKMNK